MIACSKNTRINLHERRFCIQCKCVTPVQPLFPNEDGLKEKLESALSQTKLQEYKVSEENGRHHHLRQRCSGPCQTLLISVSMLQGVTFECLAEAGFEDDFVEFYNSHIGTACDGSGIGLKLQMNTAI